MTTGAQRLRAPSATVPPAGSILPRARAYFASDVSRTLQTALGLFWLLDGGLQFQSFMYSRGFIQFLTGMTAGQPTWLYSSMNWAAHTAGHNLTVFNTLFALVQVALGVGLLYRRTVRSALALSIVWAVFVWWFGEAFGMMFMSMASPLTGAPGAVSLYGLLALVAWPNGRRGGLLGVRGTRIAWGIVWILMAWLWLEAPSSNPNAITDAINAAPSGMSWLSTVQDWAANGAAGDGVPIALVMAGLSATIGLAVALDWRPRLFLGVSVVLNLAFWVFGQGFGGIFQGGATDPNAGPLFVLFAWVLYSLLPPDTARPAGDMHGEAPESATATAQSTNVMTRLTGHCRPRLVLKPAAILLGAGVLLAGCASADKTATSTGTSSTGSSGMVGMSMGGSGTTQASGVNGIKPVPTQMLASAAWQGMRITAQATTGVPFVIYNGTTEKVVKPGHASFHLMVMLSDAQTHVPIPYASVWATIKKNGRIISDERQWPMISRYMGPHYGNDVTVPGAGTYQLSLLVSPPVSARHMEYANVWTRPHRVDFTFHWKPAS